MLETASVSWVWVRWGGTMVEASVVEASFLLADESTKGGFTAEEWFSWGVVEGRRCGWSEEWAHPMTLCCSSLLG